MLERCNHDYIIRMLSWLNYKDVIKVTLERWYAFLIGHFLFIMVVLSDQNALSWLKLKIIYF